MNIARLLARAGSSSGELPAVAVGARTVWTYRQLAQRTARIAGGMLAAGLAPGDRVALVMRNCADYVPLMFAGWWAGLTVVPVNAKLHPRELAYIIEHCGARLVLVTGDIADLPGIGARVMTVGSPELESLATAEPVACAERLPDDVAWLFYTSGTTGRPKGAMLSHRNLMAMTLCYFGDVDRIDPGDAIIHAAPMSHGSGLYILPHVAGAAVQVVPESGGLDPAETARLIGAWPGTTMFAAPTMVVRLIDDPGFRDADLRHLKTIVYGGAPMYLADCQRALALLGPRLSQIYGQGESPMTITALSKARHGDTGHPRYLERLASAGVPYAAIEVMLVDEDGRPVPTGEPGEVCARGDPVMLGYWGDEAATAAALRHGWLHTGDVGVLDEDGFLTLRDRSKDLIISGGSNIYPREVEEVLLTHPGVREVAVIGAPHPEWGETVVAFVVGDPERPPAEAELDRHCLAAIARFKRPRRYRMVEALPKNAYGKVLKRELREQLAASDIRH
jgi:long-chain acyl-CoA synthetase